MSTSPRASAIQEVPVVILRTQAGQEKAAQDPAAPALDKHTREAATRLRNFSFPNTGDGTAAAQMPRTAPGGGRQSFSGKHSRVNSLIEKSINMEESQSEALFNHLKAYTIGDAGEQDNSYSRLKTTFWLHSRKSSDESPRMSVLSTQHRNSLFSTGNTEEQSSTGSVSSSSSFRRTNHRRSREYIPLQQLERLSIVDVRPVVGKDDPSARRGSSALANAIARDTSEQIRRNSTGVFASLRDFAAKTGAPTKGRVFAHCPETGDASTPVIDLEPASDTTTPPRTSSPTAVPDSAQSPEPLAYSHVQESPKVPLLAAPAHSSSLRKSLSRSSGEDETLVVGDECYGVPELHKTRSTTSFRSFLDKY
ncbi:AGL270Wp [Eremothecium gossypii ATCC 10895]|uniref:AGL270Wp n=1 Tax=Eremothecium gossypii (strain ATCC 10895 / CBS 109.51 / FGSC 9923 / NRRL Y-1056) TaxID=284811 RepID=Q751H6_EREGS|nr:AGL270Wp [Eremothecium gossypii ATCC 10895]AAS54221.1 AGL270Wp [Eremothecium gossypii ATCC 10895]AEY98547.1 FAGL270Wp [Eremothecium gossypii FDAG1]